MSSTHNPGRIAGFLYLLLIVFAPFRLIYIPSTLIVRGNATATANNIAAKSCSSVSGWSATCFGTARRMASRLFHTADRRICRCCLATSSFRSCPEWISCCPVSRSFGVM
jgi:hypothetical protein